jgi:hypothetical protein
VTGYVASTIPGLHADGTTDDSTTINNAISSLSAGGVLYLPPGQIAIGQRLSVAKGVILAGSGAIQKMGSTTGLAAVGTVLIPTGANTDTIMVELAGEFSGVRDLLVDAETSINHALAIDNTDCSAVGCSFLGGSGYTVDSNVGATSSDRFNMIDCWVDTSRTGTAGLALRALGLDWIVSNCRVRAGKKELSGPGKQWVNCHFTGGGPNVSLGGSAEQIFTGCYFDSSSATALIVHESGAGQCLFTGCKYYQMGTPGSPVPVFQEMDTTPAASVAVVGGDVPSGAQAFTYFVAGATTFTQVSGLSIDSGAVTETTPGTVFDATPGHVSNVFLDGSALNQTITGIMAGSGTLYLVSTELGIAVPGATPIGAFRIVYALMLNGYKSGATRTLNFPHSFTLDTPILSASPSLPGAFVSGLTVSKTSISIPATQPNTYTGYILLQGA